MKPLRFACDAMCGGLARWLRAFGYDTFYEEGIDDGVLVRRALDEDRVLISSDGKMFERCLVRDGHVKSHFLPRGLKLMEQVALIVRSFQLAPGDARCMACNGELDVVNRDEVADVVPARSLLYATRFFRCRACERVMWNGTHWERIERVRQALSASRPGKP